MIGLEVTRAPDPISNDAGICVVHVELPDDPVSALASIRDLSTSDQGVENRKQLQGLLPEGVVVGDPQSRATTLSHVTFSSQPTEIMGATYEAWRPEHQWLWLLGSASSTREFPPDPDDSAIFNGLLRFSKDWQALVLRDGVAFVGLTADAGDDSAFHAVAEVYVHSIYLDIILAGIIQRNALNQLMNEIAQARRTRLEPGTLARLERRMYEARSLLWLRYVTARGKGNELLHSYQDQNHTRELLAQVTSDLTDMGRYVNAVTNRRINVALGLIASLGAPFAVSYAAGATWGEGTPRSFLVWTAVAIAISVALLGLLEPLRSMVNQSLGRNRTNVAAAQEDTDKRRFLRIQRRRANG